MAKKFKVLHIGSESLDRLLRDTPDRRWTFLSVEALGEVTIDEPFDFIFIQCQYSDVLKEVLQIISTPYSTYVDAQYWSNAYDEMSDFYIRKLDYINKEHLLSQLDDYTFAGQYGDKIGPMTALINKNFDGTSYYNGNREVLLEGTFGDKLQPLLTWKSNLFYDKYKAIEIFPQFHMEGDISLEYTFRMMPQGSADKILNEITVSHQGLEQPLILPGIADDGIITVTLKAKGHGKLSIGPIHKRWSRGQLGQFLLGGEKYCDRYRDEFIYYLHPGDMKPPLNVYFSGYRPAEGFEGYFMMKTLGAPFLLIADPRLEGGSFYMGSASYEQAVKDVISVSLDKLGFSSDQLILSGLSMGSFGALYYGVQLNPAAVIVGKPLVNAGTIADNMRLLRPDDFGTSLDVLNVHQPDRAVQQLNDKFWNVMRNGRFDRTTFAVSYMENDDYDPVAFDDLLTFLSQYNSQVISRGVPGRHNDDSPTITNWFINFYHVILNRDFGRTYHE